MRLQFHCKGRTRNAVSVTVSGGFIRPLDWCCECGGSDQEQTECAERTMSGGCCWTRKPPEVCINNTASHQSIDYWLVGV